MVNLSINDVKIAEFTIITSANPSELERFAAQEFRDYIEKVCGASLEIKTDSEVEKPNEIVIGKTNREPKSYEKIRNMLEDDGVAISYLDGRLYIYGGEKRGTLYAVYQFLEYFLHVRWYASDCEKYPDELDANISRRTNIIRRPVIAVRDSFWYDYIKDSGFAVKHKINSGFGRKIPEHMGGSVDYVGGRNCHTLAELLPESEYFAEHPEYYALVKGERKPTQPCLSNPKVLEIVIKNAKKWIKQYPGGDIISITQNDNFDYCTCEKCSSVISAEGSPSGPLLRFVNAVADAIKEEYPDILVDTFAYLYTQKAPKITVPRDNVVIRLCSIDCCFNHPLNDSDCPKNVEFCEDFKQWKRICDKIYIWDYTTNFRDYLASFPNLHTISPNLKYYADNGVQSVFEQGEYQGPSGEFGELKGYMIAKLLWNPYMSKDEFDYWVYDFLKGYYGSGWRYIKEYLDILDEATEGMHITIFAKMRKFLVNLFGRTEELNALWDKAEELAGDSIDHVQKSRLQLDYLMLIIPKPEDRRGTEWEARRDKFREQMRKYKVRFSEQYDINQMSDDELPDRVFGLK